MTMQQYFKQMIGAARIHAVKQKSVIAGSALLHALSNDRRLVCVEAAVAGNFAAPCLLAVFSNSGALVARRLCHNLRELHRLRHGDDLCGSSHPGKGPSRKLRLGLPASALLQSLMSPISCGSVFVAAAQFQNK